MKILVSGSTGLVGTALLPFLRQQGHEVARLIRPSTRNRAKTRRGTQEFPSIAWDPGAGGLAPEANGADAVVHLAGASIADARWTASRKRELQDSRISATRHLVGSLGQLAQPPKIFIAASAIGYYGDRSDEPLKESSTPGDDFLAELCVDWEAESMRAAQFGARVVLLRFGIILAKKGGALPRMVLPFRFGAGGRIGSGHQWMSWITLVDVIHVISFALMNGSLKGPLNVVAPAPVPNSEFAATIGRVLHRPAALPTPAFVLRFALGELADALLFSSQRVIPERLLQTGYHFEHQQLEPALQHILRH